MLYPDNSATPPAVRRLLLGLLLGALAVLCGVVLRPFIVPVIWAAIMAYTTWPAHRQVLRLCRQRYGPAALVTTVIVALVLLVPLVWLALLVPDEVTAAMRTMRSYQPGEAIRLPALVRAIPWLGDAVQQLLDRYLADPGSLRQLLGAWGQQYRSELLGVVGDVGRSVAKLAIAVLTLFFLYRDGESLVRQAIRILQRFFDDRLDRYVRAAAAMTRAVVLGLVVTALIQGTVAGIGYAVVGVEAPVLLGLVTALASIVPVVGTFLVWGTASLVLFATGHLWPALGLLAWGTVLVHPIDNLLRPFLISNATQLPFLLVMFGVLGGLAAFGVVGIFIGPIVLALATAVWREWLEERREAWPPPA
jgi:predicted PurR-regulated permease PerM